MFCPKCGSNQGDGKKFCTVCGTNLFIVSQALTGQLQQPPIHYAPPAVSPLEIERQQEMRQGITMTVLGGGYIVYKLISFIFSFPFYGWRSPFGFLSFIAFIMFAIGISKVLSSRVTAAPSKAVNPVSGPVSSLAPSRLAHPLPSLLRSFNIRDDSPTNNRDQGKPATDIERNGRRYKTSGALIQHFYRFGRVLCFAQVVETRHANR